MAKKKILIIGGGMAGMVATILLAKEGLKVTLFERNDKIGKKILATGNGRCNLTNANIKPSNYHSSTKNIFQDIFCQFDLEKTLNFLNDLGLETVKLESGKIYPQSMQAMSVVKALLFYANELGVEIIYNSRVKEIFHKDKFCIKADKKSFYGEYLVITTGGKSYASSGSSGDGYILAKSLGHSITQQMPSIVQLVTDNPYNKSLKGLRVDVEAKLINQKSGNLIRKEYGEILFTDYGISGPVTLQLSTMVAPLLKNGTILDVSVNFFPNFSFDNLDEVLIKRLTKFPLRTIEESLNGFINQRLIIPLLKYADVEHLKKAGNITKQERARLISAFKNYTFSVKDTYTWDQAQVTKGGVSCNEIYENTLESKLIKNLYFAGEILDIDGDCGGYNLQWAISSGAVVAYSILNS
ncbi:NAD(P)/FAD-dependent oxidoreductase [Campylobacter blaseri]|uniref:Aminoacetone oxidase family FAD-binding enzyme n=1 Tax=Campylobacter blaseri TaxID=2042961 RepID=A0A2P8QYX1_9BACT|nr:NAD(P)/FAD-dependent oxidoreductase [Campylobacter blaseri]PSM51450.1 aminoacetone oxidase family FAD-binding enzyme [Campylobacter blaseri]PSM52899.1 aminoacetone oxidase family FAD-binding enzyme [Campylobacter blaseri]QKF86546.1 NAD(P)/FAD-dependent oxidoreductase [Campylobacter blaseri]